MACNLPTVATLPQSSPCIGHAPHQSFTAFTHLIKTRVNAVKFAHQLLCNPKNLDIIESRTKRIPQRVSEHHQEVDSKVFKPKPSYGKRAYEEAQAWNQEYDTEGQYEAVVHTCA